MKTRYRIERLTHGGWEYLWVFTSEDAAIRRLQRERELDAQAARDGWIAKPSKFRLVWVKG